MYVVPTGSEVTAQVVAVALVTVTAPLVPQELIAVYVPVELLEVEKVIVPPAAETQPVRAAVRVTEEPYVGAEGEKVTVAGVNVVTALALPTAASTNNSKYATLLLHLWTREEIARIPRRIVSTGMDSVSNILRSSAIEELALKSQWVIEIDR